MARPMTRKQITVLGKVVEAGEIDLDELIAAVGNDQTKQAFQFVVRALIGHGMIVKKGLEKRRGRNRVVFRPTELGKKFVGAGSAGMVEPEAGSLEDEIEKLLEGV